MYIVFNATKYTYLSPWHILASEERAGEFDRQTLLVVLWLVLTHTEQHCSRIGRCNIKYTLEILSNYCCSYSYINIRHDRNSLDSAANISFGSMNKL